MLEPTKKHHIDKVELHFVGPSEMQADAIKAMHDLGFVDAGATGIPSWRQYFPEMEGNETGTYLSGARHREKLTQRELAQKTNIPQRHISEMENGKRTIGKKNAKALAKVLKTDYRVFL